MSATATAIAFLRTLKAHLDDWTPEELMIFCQEFVPELQIEEITEDEEPK